MRTKSLTQSDLSTRRPRETRIVDQRAPDRSPAKRRQGNPTLLALGAGLLGLIAILMAFMAMIEDRRREMSIDETAQRLGEAAKQVDSAARKVVDGLQR